MKKMITFLLTLISCFSHSQTITVSEDIPLRNDASYEIIGEMKGRMLLFHDKTTEFEVQAFNSNMHLIWNKELELDKRFPKILGLLPSKDNFTVIYRFKKKSRTMVKAHKYDAAANIRDSVTIKDYSSLFYVPDFEIIRSEDKSKALIYYFDRQHIIKALAFDIVNMEVMWEKSISLDHFTFHQEFRQLIVDNDGNMRLILEKENFKTRRDEHHFEIFEYYGEGKLRRYTIPLGGKLTYDVYFVFDNLNKKLVAAGLYSDKNQTKAAGYFYLSIPPQKPDDHLLHFEEFDNEFVSNLVGKEIQENKGITETIIQEIVLRRDGGLLMIAERNRQFERRVAGTSRVYYDYAGRFIVDYFYDELFVISIHPDGQTHWKTILHKKQYSQDDDGMYSSYFLFKTPSSLRFLFNDEIKYENTVSEYVLSGKGEFDRNSLLSTENLQLRLRFRDALQIGARGLIVPSERRNRLKLVKLEY